MNLPSQAPAPSPRRGITRVSHLRARCCVDTQYPGCWHWLGAKAGDGTPRIHTFDHERGAKRSMSGPKAVWNIANRSAPGAMLVYRRCVTNDCVNPAHHARANDRAEIGRHVAMAGTRKGTHVEARRDAARLGRMVQGIVETPDEIVLAIRQAPKDITSTRLAEIHGLSRSATCRIRRGESRRGVAEE